jgi:hypothetical protein
VLAGTVLEHRLTLRPEAQMRGVTAPELLVAVLEGIKIPIHRSS